MVNTTSTTSTTYNPFSQINLAINNTLNALNTTSNTYTKNQTTIIQNILQIQNATRTLEIYVHSLVNDTNSIKSSLKTINQTLTNEINSLNSQMMFISNAVSYFANITNSFFSHTSNDMYTIQTSMQFMGTTLLGMNSTVIL